MMTPYTCSIAKDMPVSILTRHRFICVSCTLMTLCASASTLLDSSILGWSVTHFQCAGRWDGERFL